MDEWCHEPPSESESEDGWFSHSFDETRPAPTMVALPADPPVVVAASGVHGVGMFATRDLKPGDFLEFAPLLPVMDAHYGEDDAVNDYTFQCEFVGGTDGDRSFLQLGGGCIYNHSEDHTVADHTFADNPFLRKWYAMEDIPCGHEALSSYGDDYWTSRGLKP